MSRGDPGLSMEGDGAQYRAQFQQADEYGFRCVASTVEARALEFAGAKPVSPFG
jgi:hypothetical protein